MNGSKSREAFHFTNWSHFIFCKACCIVVKISRLSIYNLCVSLSSYVREKAISGFACWEAPNTADWKYETSLHTNELTTPNNPKHANHRSWMSKMGRCYRWITGQTSHHLPLSFLIMSLYFMSKMIFQDLSGWAHLFICPAKFVFH